jgi:glucosamine--fructose-6-phosphate aminotransferase (isomerizing)
MTWMADEIAEQPATLAATIDALLAHLADLRDLVYGGRAVIFFARGSSDTAAVYGRYLCEIDAGVPCSLGAPSIATLYGATPTLRDTVAVIVSQSGRTDEMVAVAEWARRQGARTVGITNDGSSALASAVDFPVLTRAGSERAVPATKTHTAQLCAVAVLAAALATDGSPIVRALRTVPSEAERILHSTTHIAETAHRLSHATALAFTGRGYTMATALELALKAQETCGIPALGLSAADLQHGPLALINASVPSIVIAPPTGAVLPTLAAIAAQLRSRRSWVVGIGGDLRFRAECDVTLEGPNLPECVAPIVAVIPGQLLVEATARECGTNPDAPAGLAKITQTTQ